MSLRNFLEKLRALPDSKKKIILWVIVGVVAFGMGFFWFREVVNSIPKINEAVKKVNIPKFDILTTTPSK